MANLHFGIYQGASKTAIRYPLETGKVAVGGTSTQSAALGNTGNTSIGMTIELCPDVDCQYEIGTNPTADGDSLFLPANVVIYKHIDPGDKVAVIEKQ